ncbi:MAG TPA: hypothetical protein VK369_09170, partial [Segetibacter sp.]|nr:hypothetical protein [Segetibacter sp.]
MKRDSFITRIIKRKYWLGCSYTNCGAMFFLVILCRVGILLNRTDTKPACMYKAMEEAGEIVQV